MNLYNIDADLQQLENELVEAGGEISEEMDARLNEILDSREDKVDGYIAVIRSQIALAEGFKKEASWFTAKQKSRENVALRLKERLYESMQARNETELKGVLGRVAIEGNGGQAPIVALYEKPEYLPKRFQKVTITADNDAIRKALERGGDNVALYAELGMRGTHLANR